MLSIFFVSQLACTTTSTSIEELGTNFCELEVSCYPEDYDSQEECNVYYVDLEANLESFSETCQNNFLSFMQCLSGIKDCDTLEAYWDETEANPCVAEEEAIEGCDF